jgi:hypothetical protein
LDPPRIIVGRIALYLLSFAPQELRHFWSALGGGYPNLPQSVISHILLYDLCFSIFLVFWLSSSVQSVFFQRLGSENV